MRGFRLSASAPVMRRGIKECLFAAGVLLLVAVNYHLRNQSLSPRPSAPPPPRPARQLAPLPRLHVFATFTDGASFGEGMHLLVSTDGLAWRVLDGAPAPASRRWCGL